MQLKADRSAITNELVSYQEMADRSPRVPSTHEHAVVQRKVVVDDKNTTDYAILTPIGYYLKQPGENQKVQEITNANYSDIGNGEALHVFAHGSPGQLGPYNAAALLQRFNHQATGIPAHTSQIDLLSCQAGAPIGSTDQTLVDQVAAGLTHPDIPVKGAIGFAITDTTAGEERSIKTDDGGDAWVALQTAMEKQLSPQQALDAYLKASSGRSFESDAKAAFVLTNTFMKMLIDKGDEQDLLAERDAGFHTATS